MANSIGEKELKTKWPHESGLTGGTQSQTGRTINLVPVKDLVAKRHRIGVDY